MSASAPAGRINRKNGSVAAVDIMESSNVDWLMLFIIQVAAVSCADTQLPERTVANQSLLKVGFFKALQLEVVVIIAEESSTLPFSGNRSCFVPTAFKNHKLLKVCLL
jgi:hypothetical protein